MNNFLIVILLLVSATAFAGDACFNTAYRTNSVERAAEVCRDIGK